MMKCRFCDWAPPEFRKDGKPMMFKGRTDRLERHMGREHPTEYRQFREARFQSERKSAGAEQSLTTATREDRIPPRWDLYGRKV